MACPKGQFWVRYCIYCMYVNDICKASEGNILSFADDTSLYVSDHNMEKLFEKANNEMKKLYDWFCANQLSLNPGKTKFIVFNTSSNKQISTGLKLFINDTSLTQVGSKFKEKSTKFLGIQIDESLSWKNHLAYINNKISHALFGIKQVKNILPIDCLKTLYFTLIQPHLTYGILAWGNVNSTALHKTILL